MGERSGEKRGEKGVGGWGRSREAGEKSGRGERRRGKRGEGGEAGREAMASSLALAALGLLSAPSGLLRPRLGGPPALVGVPPHAFVRHTPAARMAMSPLVIEHSMRPILVTVSICIAAMLPTAFGAFAPGTRSNKKLWRRGFTGFSFAVFVSSWIFSGTYAFLSVFAAFAVIAQNEYYNMARRNGANPTWKLGLIGSVLMYMAAASPSPMLRDAVFSLTGCGTIVYLLLRSGFEENYAKLFPWFKRRTPPTTYDDVGHLPARTPQGPRLHLCCRKCMPPLATNPLLVHALWLRCRYEDKTSPIAQTPQGG